MIAFRNFIEQYTVIPDDEWQIIYQSFERKQYRKNEIILEQGKVCKYFYFLEEGLIRYFIIKDGNDITKFFTSAQHCFTSKDSLREQKPAEENIQALEDSLVWRSSLSQIHELMKLKSWEIFSRKLIHNLQSYTESLMMEIKTETAEQRYLNLLKQHQDVLHRIPLKHLSSFLGIAPQSLSRIRKKHQNKQN